MNENQFYSQVEQIVLNVLKDKGMLLGDWHLGEVDVVISPTKLKVFVNGDTESQTISCNPDITFSSGDRVCVIYKNGNSRDKFVISRSGL